MANFQIQAGSVSSATLRSYDLIESFYSFLAEHGENDLFLVLLRIEYPEFFQKDGELLRGNWLNYPEIYDTETAMYLLESLEDRMMEIAPDGMYFGTTDGDGADFGFWTDEEYEDDNEEEEEEEEETEEY